MDLLQAALYPHQGAGVASSATRSQSGTRKGWKQKALLYLALFLLSAIAIALYFWWQLRALDNPATRLEQRAPAGNPVAATPPTPPPPPTLNLPVVPPQPAAVNALDASEPFYTKRPGSVRSAAVHAARVTTPAAPSTLPLHLRPSSAIGSTPDAATLILEIIRADQANASPDEGALRELLAASPANPALYFALGNLYAHQQRWHKAQDSYFNAFRLAPNNPDYCYNLAVSLDHLALNTQAADFYSRALSLLALHPAHFSATHARQRLQQIQALAKQ